MKVLAVTGGIGSGKSHILKIFSALGVPVYNTDERTKELYLSDNALLEKLVSLLGKDIVVDGVLQKGVMAQKVFTDSAMLNKLENIVHPVVIGDFYRWKSIQAEIKAPFLIIESAIFLEKPLFRPLADKVLAISAPLDLRISRVVARDNVTEAQIKVRMNNQWIDSQREALADYVIYSDQQSALLPQVVNVFNEIING